MHRPIALALLGLPLAALPASASPPLVRAMPPAEEACYGRVYDAAHLAANPRQTIGEIFLARLHTPDLEREDEPATPDQSIATAVHSENDPQYRSTTLQVMALTREPGGRYAAPVNCTSQDGITLQCGVDCDGGGLSARVSASEASIRFRERGVRLGPGCGERGNIMLGARPTDRNVRMTRLPVSACLAAREAARPDWVRHGPPLSRTLAERGTACFSRSYGEDHLARTPDQEVAAVTLRATWRSATEIAVTLRARVRDGATGSVTIQCHATGYHFACEPPGVPAEITLTRGPNGGVILRSRLAEPEEGSEAQPQLAAALDLPLGPADDVFQLEPADAQACAE